MQANSLLNAPGAGYATLGNAWNSNLFMQQYEQVNNPFYPFYYGNPTGYATNTNPDPFFWGQPQWPKYCNCGASLTISKSQEGYCDQCGQVAPTYENRNNNAENVTRDHDISHDVAQDVQQHQHQRQRQLQEEADHDEDSNHHLGSTHIHKKTIKKIKNDPTRRQLDEISGGTDRKKILQQQRVSIAEANAINCLQNPSSCAENFEPHIIENMQNSTGQQIFGGAYGRIGDYGSGAIGNGTINNGVPIVKSTQATPTSHYNGHYPPQQYDPSMPSGMPSGAGAAAAMQSQGQDPQHTRMNQNFELPSPPSNDPFRGDTFCNATNGGKKLAF